MFIPRHMALQNPLQSSSDKREAILNAATILFAERGFHGTAVPDIAALAKVGAGTIYRYFPSKEALANALYQHHKAAMADALLGGLDLTAPPRKVFRDFWRRSCVFARENVAILQFLELQHHASYLDETSRKIEGQLLDLARAFLDRGIEEQVLRAESSNLLMAIIWGAFRGVFQGGCDRSLVLDDATIDAAETCVWEAIRR